MTREILCYYVDQKIERRARNLQLPDAWRVTLETYGELNLMTGKGEPVILRYAKETNE